MTNQDALTCYEVAIFRSLAAVTSAQVLSALQDVEPWLMQQPGYVRRAIRFDAEQQQWIDMVEWKSADDVREARQRLQEAPCAAALGAVIDMTSLRMLHGAPCTA